MAGTCGATKGYRQKPFAIINLENHVFRVRPTRQRKYRNVLRGGSALWQTPSRSSDGAGDVPPELSSTRV